MEVQGRSCQRVSFKSIRFSQKKTKVGYFSNRVIYLITGYIPIIVYICTVCSAFSSRNVWTSSKVVIKVEMRRENCEYNEIWSEIIETFGDYPVIVDRIFGNDFNFRMPMTYSWVQIWRTSSSEDSGLANETSSHSGRFLLNKLKEGSGWMHLMLLACCLSRNNRHLFSLLLFL